jgi:hypothetical protein
MGRMKDFLMEVLDANDGIPEGMTIADVARMKQMEIYNWQEYEQQQEKNRLQFNQSENSGEITKIEQSEKLFREAINKKEAEE